MNAKIKQKKNQAIPGRHIVLFNENTAQTLKKAQNEFDIKLTSSEELSSDVRSHDIMNSGSGLYFKNLGIAVIDNIESGKLIKSSTSNNSILHWEQEKEFRAINELEILKEIKDTNFLLQQKIDELEFYLKNKDLNPISNLTPGLELISLKNAKFTGKGINVVILDTGFYSEHPDFENRTIIGKSFIENEPWYLDGNGHGTHCTGTALGYKSKVNGRRYGVANEANIVIGKVLSDSGSGSTSGIIDAIDWALEKQFRIVSMSLGSPVNIGDPPSPIFEIVGKKALEKNCLIIAAAGNDSRRPNLPKPVSSPANAESIMAVAAIDTNLKVANFSNGGINASDGGKVDVSASGVGVFSSFSKNAPNGRIYASLNGTSMATPHVAGVAALYCEAFPNLSAIEIWKKLENQSKKLENQLFRDIGHGLVQAV